MTAPFVIGLAGAPRAGKDTVADHLVTARGYRRVAFADPLKAAAHASLEGLPDLHDAVTNCGWDFVKTETAWGRPYLQDFGMAIRELDPEFWIRAAMADVAASDRPVVIPDVRFANEVDAIRQAGGAVVLVERPGFGAVNGHRSEHEWRSSEFDARIVNSGSLRLLAARVGATARELEGATLVG